MATSVYVARSLGVDTGIITGGSTVGTIVSADDALDTHDGDGSYVLLARDGTLTGGTERTEMPFRWERVSGPAPSSVTSVTVEGALRRDDTATPATAFVANFILPGEGGLWVWLIASDAPDDYIDRTTSVDPYYAPNFESGEPWLIAPNVPDPFFRQAFRITYLRATVESGGAVPMRLMQRGDGLGMGSGRVYSTGTRQGSSRVYGTY